VHAGPLTFVRSTLPVSLRLSFPRNPVLSGAIVYCFLAATMALLWLPLAPTRLFDFDAANFALALDDFQPAAHQPQPPGYPLYVALTRLIHLFVSDVPLTFLTAGILGSALSVLLLWLLARQMFGTRAAFFPALLLLTSPVLWQTAMTNQVRIYIAVISIAIALVLWPGWLSRLTLGRLLAAASLLGLLAGFRPEMALSMAPLLFLTALRSRMKIQHHLLAAVALACGMAPWLTFLFVRVGGPANFLAMMQAYSAQEAGRSSLLFGAGLHGAWTMLAGALWWVSLGIATCLPAALFVPWRGVAWKSSFPPSRASFLLAWFVTLFLFSVVVHIAASGHSLGFIPVLCLLGGWILSTVSATRDRRLATVLIVAALGLNVVLFFKPYARGVKEASYKTVGVINGINEITMQKIDTIIQQGPAVIVTDSEWVPWRILEYSYPTTPLVFLPAPAAPEPPSSVWLIRNRAHTGDVAAGAEIPLPACGTIIWMLSDDQSRRSLLAIEGAESERFLIATPATPGMHFRLGRYRLASPTQPCSNSGLTLALQHN